MIKFKLKKEKIKFSTDQKKLKKAIEKYIKNSKKLGFKKNTALAMLISKLRLKTNMQEEGDTVLFEQATKEDIKSSYIILKEELPES